jgi:predicted dehydrogenase
MIGQINRRDFIKRASAGTVGASLAITGASTRSVLGANDRIRLGLIGCGRQGIDNMQHFIKKGVEVAAVCDVYESNLQKGLEAAGGKAKALKDFRQVLDDKEIDMVLIATPDHWHALPTVMACQAGKDVYVEKPISVAVEEGKKMVEAARKYKRVVQVGLWQRSNLHFQRAVELVQDGMIGKVTFVRTWNFLNIYPSGIGNPPDCDPPAGLDWDMWLGPAPKVPFNWNRFGVIPDRWSTFRYFYDYANGWPGDWGVHVLDIAQWAMRVDGPNVITASGRKFYMEDNCDTPDTLQITLEYPGFIATYENRQCNGNSMYKRSYGTEFHGTDGTLFVDRDGFEVTPEGGDPEKKKWGRTAEMKMECMDGGLTKHVANMLDCMKTRKLPQSDIEIGYHSTSTCLLANVALRTKERLEWDVATGRLTKGGPAAQKLLNREYRSPWKLVV